jgi:hypothetical protein
MNEMMVRFQKISDQLTNRIDLLIDLKLRFKLKMMKKLIKLLIMDLKFESMKLQLKFDKQKYDQPIKE